MELLQLRYFMKSAETENFSDTAAKYMVPPSAVSASVKKLERELGVILFDRSANRIKLNKSGKRFADAVSQALLLLDSEVARINEEKNGITGDIYLLVKSERSLVTDKMVAFRDEHASVNFHLVHSHALGDYSEYDIIIDESSNKYEGFTKKAIISERIKIAASKNSPLVGRRLRIEDLKGIPFISMSKSSSLYRIAENICINAGFKPNIVIESDDPYYIRKYIAEDFGIAMFPELSWKNDMADIEFLDVVDFDFMRTTYAYLNSMNANNAARLFFEQL